MVPPKALEDVGAWIGVYDLGEPGGWRIPAADVRLRREALRMYCCDEDCVRRRPVWRWCQSTRWVAEGTFRAVRWWRWRCVLMMARRALSMTTVNIRIVLIINHFAESMVGVGTTRLGKPARVD